MSVCLICCSPSTTAKSLPSCSCIFCSECLFTWLSLKVKEYSYQLTDKINCPNEYCITKYSIGSEILFNHSFTKFQQESLEQATFFKYLKNTSDIIGCPNGNCNYYGFSNPDEVCKDKYNCEICGNSWQEKSFMPDKIFEKINAVLTGKMINELLSYFYQEIFTENCPNCMISISRNGGCYHMTCKKCEYQFCWYCKQKYEGHKLNVCMMNMLVKFFLLMVLTFWVLGSFGLHRVVWEGLICFCCFALKYMIFYNIVLMMFLLYAIYVYQYISLRNDIKKRKPEAGVIFFGSISLFVLIFLIRKGYVFESLLWWSFEGIIAGIVYNLINLFTFVYKNWISLVD